MTRRGVWACVALAGVAGAGLALWLCGSRGGRGPVRPAGVVETVAADGGRSFVSLYRFFAGRPKVMNSHSRRPL